MIFILFITFIYHSLNIIHVDKFVLLFPNEEQNVPMYFIKRLLTFSNIMGQTRFILNCSF